MICRVRTGGLEASIALHVVNNLLGSLFSAAYGDLSVDETAADLPWQLALVDTGCSSRTRGWS